MLQRVKESGIASALRASNIHVIEAAEPPFRPYKPGLVMNAMLGLMTGFLSAVGVAFMRIAPTAGFRRPGISASI